MLAKMGAVTFAVGLLVAACGAPAESVQPSLPTTSGQPTTTGLPATSQQPEPQTPTPAGGEPTPPASSSEPPPTALPEVLLEPLGAPELETPEEVAEALFNPDLAEQAVVSMLAQLGIGLYASDGTPIRPGTETSDDDLFLFEEEARALIETLENPEDPEEYISFRDYHEAVAGLGYTGSAEELASTYVDSYAQDPTAQVSQYINAVAFLDVEAEISRFAAWLLFVDGFVPPHGSAETAFGAGAGGGLVAQGTGRWGISQRRLQRVQNTLAVAHLMLVVRNASITVTGASAHEGHGGPGQPVNVTAYVSVPPLISPLTGNSLVLRNPGGGPVGIPITWEPHPELYAHGNLASLSGTTSSAGEVRTQFIPQAEAADGQGYVVRESVKLDAAVSSTDLLNALYVSPPLRSLVRTKIRGQGAIDVEWHVLEAMKITMDYHYDVEIRAIVGKTHGVGDDSIEGILAKQDDGTWTGFLTGRAVGSQDSIAFGRSCTSRWDATQVLAVTGREAPNALFGDFIFRFEPAVDARGQVGTGRCPPTRTQYYGTRYAPFGDAAVQSAGIDEGLVIILPQKPGGTQTINKPALPPGTGIIISPDTRWTITIEFLDPP